MTKVLLLFLLLAVPTHSYEYTHNLTYDYDDDHDHHKLAITYYQKQIGLPLDDNCLHNYYFRSLDGSCNWLVKDEHTIGMAGTALHREYGQVSFTDGISKPRDGPNPRLVSNAFFERNQTIYYPHTQIITGLVEFVIHDLVFVPRDDKSTIKFEVPKCDQHFDPDCVGNKHFYMWDSKPVPGTGTSTDNPKQIVNAATSWLDLSPLYGTSKQISDKLRSFVDGKLKTSDDGYLPFNDMGLNINSYTKKNFAGGDPRTNQDWMVVAIHTLLHRNHNRLCDIFKVRHGLTDDELIFQYARTANIANYFLILAQYQASYFEDVHFPHDDGTIFIREFYDESLLTINNFYTYPWSFLVNNHHGEDTDKHNNGNSKVTYNRPPTTSHEVVIGYRFHDFVPDVMSIIDDEGNVTKMVDVVLTTYDSAGFVDTGLESILRGMATDTTPGFHSGWPHSLRNFKMSLANPEEFSRYDMAAFSIAQERARGVPTFNQYVREYNKRGKVPIDVRHTFEDFSSNPVLVQRLKTLYDTPDDVDLLVGIQLDEQLYPKSSIPKSAMVTSLIDLFKVAAYDRFSPAYSMMLCILGQKPWDCTPVTALDSIIWKPVTLPSYLKFLSYIPYLPQFPNAKWYDEFWLEELDIINQGQYAIWKLVTKNSDIKCLQLNPLFPADPVTNPVVCHLPVSQTWSTIQSAVYKIVLLYAIFKYGYQSSPPSYNKNKTNYSPYKIGMRK